MDDNGLQQVLLSNSIDLLSKGRPTKLSLDFLRQSLMGRESVQWEYSVENGSRSTYSKEVLDEDEDEEKVLNQISCVVSYFCISLSY